MKTTQISIPGFSINPPADDKLAVAVFGQQGSGKTRFACTAPDPIGFIPLDRKARKTVDKIGAELGKIIIMPDKDFIRTGNPVALASYSVDQAKKYYRQHLDSIKKAAFALYDHPQVETIVIDTGSQLWEDILFAEFGRSQRIMPRDRGSVNQEMIDLLNALSGKNLVITHKAGAVWRNDQPTGNDEAKGFPHLGYHVNLLIEMGIDHKKKPVKDKDGELTGWEEGRFYLNVDMCQDNPNIQGPAGDKLLVDDMINWDNLASFVIE